MECVRQRATAVTVLIINYCTNCFTSALRYIRIVIVIKMR